MKLTAERPIVDQSWKRGLHSPKLMKGANLVILCALALIIIIALAMILSGTLQKS